MNVLEREGRICANCGRKFIINPNGLCQNCARELAGWDLIEEAEQI